ncbi:MAG: hypothetical protein P8L77_05055 [Gammaproteobacteria bacterium]|nr:hypothetical protein [Gammaproteobacteria bacterium]
MLKLRKSTLQKAFIPMIISFIGFSSNYALSIALANVLNKDQFGVISYTLMINSLLATFIALGTDSNSKNFLTLYIKEKALRRLNFYISWNIEVFSKPVIISLILFSILFFIIDPFTLYFDHQLTEFEKITTTILFTAPFYAATSILSNYLLCDFKVKLFTYFFYMQTNALMAMLILVAIYTDLLQASLSLILTLFILVNIFNLISCLIAIKIKSPIIYECFKHRYHKKKLATKMHTWNKGARAQLITNFLKKAMLKIDFIIMIYFSQSHAELGIYGIAMNTAIILTAIPIGVFQHIVPSISSIVKSSKDKKMVQALWNQSLLINTLVVFLGAYGLHLYAKEIILCFYGPGFIDAAQLIQIMCITYTFTSICGCKSALFAFTGNTTYANFTYYMRIVLCIILAYAFKDYGITGVAYASLISEFTRTVISIILIRKTLNFKSLGVI